MSRKISVAALIVLFTIMCHEGFAETYGQQKKGVKGRYLVINDGVNAAQYRGALVILESAEITSDKDKPVDNEAVRNATNELLRQRLNELKASGVFSGVVATAPLELPSDVPILRLQPKVTVQHGSQAMRYFVGMGAGKSKTHIRIEIFDARIGEHLGFFNGYGSGSGLWTFTGGDTSRMSQDDVEESFNDFASYMEEAIPAVSVPASSILK